MKSLVSALGLAADRFLNRAETIDNWSTNVNVFAAIAAEHGIAPGHSVSRLTIKETQKVEIVAEHNTALNQANWHCRLRFDRGRRKYSL